jgi:hypothetical protein
MADTGRQTPLAVNMMGSLLQDSGLRINKTAQDHMGISKTNDDYSFGSICNDTSLRLLTWAINDGYIRGVPNGGSTLSVSTYNNLISIGSDTIPALGNSKPPSYVALDNAGIWARTSIDSSTPCVAEKYATQIGVTGALPGPATSGYPESGKTGQGQNATWYPYTGDSTINPNTSITQWGWIRCHALQAWNEFNYNGDSVAQDTPQYKEFLGSFLRCHGFHIDSNQSINVIDGSDTFMQYAYSNMNDLSSADIAGVSLSCVDFGTDLDNLGLMFYFLRNIETFGLPSNLLMNIGMAGAVTQDLALVLLAAGLTKAEIDSIVAGKLPRWSKDLEQSILGAFLMITGENLAHVLAPLQCKVNGLDTLADLLDLKKLFPNSYASFTVPVYNGSLGLPTNSKTYYPIYINDALNPALNNDDIKNAVGTIFPRTLVITSDSTVSPENFAELPKGFGSYLDGIIPDTWATAAGAFSYSMQQIKNIENVEFHIFSKVVKGIENFADLPLVGGTDKPADQAATDDSKRICSLGSGPVGTYTMSDFFGCMSGLPYPWRLIKTRINQLETSNLYDIYKQLFLAVTWEPATVTVQYTTYTGPGPSFDTYYHVTGLTITNPGGGYSRGGASAPIVNISNGGSGSTIVGSDTTDAESNHAGTFGRVTSVTLVSAGTDTTSVPTVTIEYPPVTNAGGTNSAYGTTGWASPMNAVVQNYIDQANAEIATIYNTNQNYAEYLNTYWNVLGQQLAREQRSRYTAMSVVPIPKDYFMNLYPNTTYSFLDSMTFISQDTRPHMDAQTLEAISDLSNLGGQSTVAKMREERNQARLMKIGIRPDNDIPSQQSEQDVKTLMANGTIGTAADNSGINGYTLPAWPENVKPAGFYDNGFQPTGDYAQGDITPLLQRVDNPVVSSTVPAGPVIVPTSPIDGIVIIAPPPDYNPNNLPPTLDPNYSRSTMAPSTLSIKDAIDHVIACNCDCWVQ